MMNRLQWMAVAVLWCCASIASAQVSATGNGGAGGSGGSATGGTAAGGTATNTNSVTSGTSSANGGTSSATGGTANVGSATSNYQGADVSVNYTTPAGAAGLNGLAAGVDPTTGHVVTDNNVRYSGTTKIKNTPDVNIGGPASGTCNGLSGGVGVGLPGIAVGANVSTVDKGCEARETARIAAMLGRMDVANAVLENMDVVVLALKAQAARDARATAAADTAAATARLSREADAAIAQATQATQAARDREAEAMRVQQQAGVDALTRQATMQKVNDTLTYTGKLTHGEEKTAQQLMAEQLAAKPAATVAPLQAAAPEAPVPRQPARPEMPAATPAAAAAPAPRPEPVAPTPPKAETARPLPAPDAGPTGNLVEKTSDHAAAATVPQARPIAVARREPVVEKARVAKPADRDDAIRFALNLDDDAKTASR